MVAVCENDKQFDLMGIYLLTKYVLEYYYLVVIDRKGDESNEYHIDLTNTDTILPLHILTILSKIKGYIHSRGRNLEKFVTAPFQSNHHYNYGHHEFLITVSEIQKTPE